MGGKYIIPKDLFDNLYVEIAIPLQINSNFVYSTSVSDGIITLSCNDILNFDRATPRNGNVNTFILAIGHNYF